VSRLVNGISRFCGSKSIHYELESGLLVWSLFLSRYLQQPTAKITNPITNYIK